MNLQEVRNTTKATGKDVQRLMETRKPHFDYYEANIYGTGIYNESELKASDKLKVLETLRKVKFANLAREFLAKSGTTGLMGAAYLIPDKIYQILYDASVEEDVCAQISAAMLGPEDIPGADLKVDIAVDGSYVPTKFSSGGGLPEMEKDTVQATLAPLSWGIHFNIGNDMIEDSQFNLVENHLAQAGREMGEYASNEALGILKAPPDGDGTVNSSATGDADETKFTGGATADIEDAYIANDTDGYPPTTMVCTRGAMLNSIYSTIPSYGSPWIAEVVRGGLPTRILGMDIVYSGVDTLTNSKAGTNLVTILFDKRYAMITGRKRWLRIENYSDPIRDLIGATVTARQDSITMYKDSVYVLTET